MVNLLRLLLGVREKAFDDGAEVVREISSLQVIKPAQKWSNVFQLWCYQVFWNFDYLSLGLKALFLVIPGLGLHGFGAVLEMDVKWGQSLKYEVHVVWLVRMDGLHNKWVTIEQILEFGLVTRIETACAFLLVGLGVGLSGRYRGDWSLDGLGNQWMIIHGIQFLVKFFHLICFNVINKSK